MLDQTIMAFGPLGFESVIILLPVSRAAAFGVRRLGFVPDGGTEFDGIPLQRFRLRKEVHGRPYDAARS